MDGIGEVIRDADANHVEQAGRATGKILRGPEFLTVFDGRTDAALATTDYVPPRGRNGDWGDDYGSRAYRGQGNHNLVVADVDGDGRDEIIYGACAINDDGTGLYSTGLGHGDALHVSDFDPDRPGLEVFGIHEKPVHPKGANLRDAATGRVLRGKSAPDVGRGVAFDIDPRHRGAEMWAAGFTELWNACGEVIARLRLRSCNMGIWWDADPLRELLDGVNVTKWNYLTGAETRMFSAADFNCVANNGSKANPSLCAGVLGDWREELICRTRDNRELRTFVSTISAQDRRPTLMHDPVYRLGIATQNVAYNQPAHPSFFLGAER